MKNRWRWILLLLLICGSVGAWFADRKLKGRGHPGLVTFAKQYWRNYPKSFAIEPPVISIMVDEAGMDELYGVVERAREAGVIEQEGNDFVKGDFHVAMPKGVEGSGDFKGKLRIKGKMTDHVEGKKWSFRVIAKKQGGFLGMQRFSLQHPGTRNYLTDWLFHQLMKGEGLIALRYGFCKVELNGEDLGVYAYEEHFGPELLENNGRLPGPIVRFDPALFWLHRTQGIDGSAKVDDAYGAYQAANLDAFGSEEIAKDPQQKLHFEQAIALIQGFRTGKLKASDVFDVERTAKRLAMLDLVGGHHSMDWSDVKFYFDPVAQRLEPISYESFSAYPTKELAGAYKATGAFNESDELHVAFFKDPLIFAAYVRQLERFSQRDWLDSAFAAIKGPLDTASATLYGEFPYKELDRSIYYKNQQAIHKLLDVPKGAQVYQQGLRGDTLTLAFVPIESLPMQVDSLMLADGRRIAPNRPAFIPSRERGKVGSPVLVTFLIHQRSSSGLANDSVLAKGSEVMYRVLGASRRKMMPVFPFIMSVSAAQDELLAGMKPNPQEFDFLAIDEVSRTITIKPGSWSMGHTLVIPAGYRCTATGPLKLELSNGAEIISYSALQWKGLDEAGIQIFSTDSSSRGVHVIGASDRSVLSYCVFANISRFAYDQPRSGDLSFHKSDATFDHCFFTGTGATLLDASTCAITLTNCRFDHGSDQLETHFAQVSMTDVIFELAKDDAISVEGGIAELNKIGIGGRDGSGVGVKGSKGARITVTNLNLNKMSTAFEGREGAKLSITNARVEEVDQVVEAKKSEMRYGPVRVDLKKVTITNAKSEFKCGAGSSITLDGKKVGETKAAGGT
ncbi:MAG: CotH kinase family protein [Flavobacteriales bacterium]|nr:CotH kinase family protein [Flavobacteriales bacterium]